MYADDFLVGQQSDKLHRGPGPMVHAMAVQQLGLVVTITVIALIGATSTGGGGASTTTNTGGGGGV